MKGVALTMNLDLYLQRIGYQGARVADLTTLCELHRAHLLAIPYENLDIHLGQRLTLDLPHIYHKIVEKQRGGWCYELNGLFAWALRTLGFRVTLLGSSVGRPAQGSNGDFDHLILRVDLARPWLVDVGFGNGFFEPLPLVAGDYQQSFRHYQLEEEGDHWYFHNDVHGGPGFGFTLLPRQFASFGGRCHELQTSPASGFVQKTVCHRFTPDGFVTLRGALLKQYSAAGVVEEEIRDQLRYRTLIEQTFGLDGTLADALWDKVWAGHERWQQTL